MMNPNEHYARTLADLEIAKAEIDTAIRTVKRLMEGTLLGSGPSTPTPKASPVADGPSIPTRVVDFLNSNPTRSFRLDELLQGIHADNANSLRGALGRMAKQGKIGKAGRGKYRAIRKPTPEPA